MGIDSFDYTLRVREIKDVCAERNVLAAMMLSQDALNKALGLLETKDFYIPSHQRIFDALRHMMMNNIKVDLTSLCDIISKRGELKDVSGIGSDNAFYEGRAYLADLYLDQVVSGTNVEYHSNIVRERSLRRQGVDIAFEAQRKFYDDTIEFKDAIADVGDRVFKIAQRDIESRSDNQDILASIDTPPPPGIMTGLVGVDDAIGGLAPGDYFCIAGRPSKGKTALCVQILIYNALADVKCAFFSEEMTKRAIQNRIIGEVCGIPINVVRSRNFTKEQRGVIAERSDDLKKIHSNIIIIDKHQNNTTLALLSKLHKAKDGIQLIALDYLQLFAGSDDVKSVSDASLTVKLIAKDLMVPFICLSQLSRLQNENDRPHLMNLRMSGSIEQDSDIVGLLWKRSEHRVTFCIDKQRNGPTMEIDLLWHPATTRFSDFVIHQSTDGYAPPKIEAHKNKLYPARQEELLPYR